LRLEVIVARSYRELLVWQKAKTLAVHTYQATRNSPKTETYGITSQIRRASVSVPSNIAEGQGRLTGGEFRHFLGQARGSWLEVETQLAVALEISLLDQNSYEALDRESYQVLGLLNRLLNSLDKKTA
jgi:four helix bundle protein